MKPSVVIADDHPAFALGMRFALTDQGFDVVGVAADGAQALALIRARAPDVAILDVRMPKRSGIDVCREVQADGRPLLVAMLSTFEDAATVAAARDAGARAFFTKETSITTIADTLRRLLAEPSLVLLAPPPLPALTAREADVLRALGRGWSNKGIAAHLDLGSETVKDHCSAIFAKLGVRDRVQAILEARRLGLLREDPPNGGAGP